MKRELVRSLHSKFETVVNVWPDSDVEFWFGREVQFILGYKQWRNCLPVIQRV